MADTRVVRRPAVRCCPRAASDEIDYRPLSRRIDVKGNLVNFLNVAVADNALIDKIWNTVNVGDLKNLAGERGFDVSDVSDDNTKRTFAVVTGAVDAEELSDEELDMVAAGGELKSQLSRTMVELNPERERPRFFNHDRGYG